jgi:hypothetical protein
VKFILFLKEKTNSKTCCKSCATICKYNLETLLSNGVNQQDINKELKEHGHPSSRKIDGRYRITNEARLELIEHYRYAHGVHVPDSIHAQLSMQNSERIHNQVNTNKKTVSVKTERKEVATAVAPLLAAPPPPAQHTAALTPQVLNIQPKPAQKVQQQIPAQQIQRPVLPVVNQSPIIISKEVSLTNQQTHTPTTNYFIDNYKFMNSKFMPNERSEFIIESSYSTLQLLEHYRYAYGLILEQD